MIRRGEDQGFRASERVTFWEFGKDDFTSCKYVYQLQLSVRSLHDKISLAFYQGTLNLLGRPVRALFFPCIFGTKSIRQQEGKLRGGGCKFS